MKKITFLLLSIILFSCDEQVEEIQEKASLFTIYNKSSHAVDIIELRPTLGTVKNEYHIAVDDSVSILTPREEHIVPPFGSGEVYLIDATLSPDEVFAEIRSVLEDRVAR